MKPLKVFVCEDEMVSLQINRVIIEEYLNRNHIEADIRCYQNYQEAEKKMLDDIELAILDIDLKGSEINGIQLAKDILKRNPGAVFIFITGHDEYALEATQIYLSGFLGKPVNQYHLQDALRRALKQVNGHRLANRNHNIAQFNNGKIILQEKSVVSIAKLPRTHEVQIVTTEKNIQTYDSIRSIESKMSSNMVKLNQSIIVNMLYIFDIEGNTVNMRGGAKYKISLRNQNKVKEAYKRYIADRLV